MNDYETVRQRHVADALALAPLLIEQLDWPDDRLARHRTRRLRELVRIAMERSPWYRKRLSGVDIDHLDESALAELPVLTKAELMEHFDDIVTAAHFSHATAAMARTFSSPRMTTVRLPVTLRTEEIVAGLNNLQPDFMTVYPSVLHALAHEAAAGRLRIAPRRVLAGAEPLLPEIRAAAELAWGVKVINIYGTSEGGGTAVGCDRGSTHISEDQLIVEPVDLAGRPVLPGERAAKIYLTNLYNPVLPLIRFEITDEVTVLPGPCPCGSAHRRIADVQGRLDDVFTYQDRRVHPHLFRTALGREAGIVEYQVRQTPAGAAIAVRCSAPVSLDGLRDRIAAGLAGAGLERPQVTVEIVDRFERPGGPAKLKRFIPLEAPAGHTRH